jgi:hypothetical protein
MINMQKLIFLLVVVVLIIISLQIECLKAQNEEIDDKKCPFQECNVKMHQGAICDVFCYVAKLPTYGNSTITKFSMFRFENLIERFPIDFLHNFRISSLYLYRCNLGYLTPEFFKGQRNVAAFSIANDPDFTSFDSDLIADMADNIKLIELIYNQMRSLRVRNLIQLEKLFLDGYRGQQIIISRESNIPALVEFRSQWSNVEQISMSGLDNLVSIKLYWNNIKKVDKNSFYDLSSLRLLDLGHGLIEELELAELPALEELLLEENNLKRITNEMFSALPYLTTLTLHLNIITHVDKESFVNQRSLNNLNLAFNYISEIPSLKNMDSLKILNMTNQNRRMIQLPNYLFDINTFRTRSGLSLELYLDNNAIAIYGERMFCPRNFTLKQIEKMQIKLDLTNSSFNTADKCLFKQLKEFNPGILIIDNSPSSQCQCVLHWFSRLMEVKYFNRCNFFICNTIKVSDDCDDKPIYDCAIDEAEASLVSVKDVNKSNEAAHISKSMTSMAIYSCALLVYYLLKI